MQIRLEKIDHTRSMKRFYFMQVAPTLFGEWVVAREWGRIGNDGGQTFWTYHEKEEEALAILEHVKYQKEQRGYVVLGEQLLMCL